MFKKFALLLIIFVPLSYGQSTDPTRPFGKSGYAKSASQKSKLVLESIVHGDQIHTVVISGQVMHVGDYIGEHRLVAVNDNSVVLRTETERLKLTVFTGVIVK